jgi:hypothetical protein
MRIGGLIELKRKEKVLKQDEEAIKELLLCRFAKKGIEKVENSVATFSVVKGSDRTSYDTELIKEKYPANFLTEYTSKIEVKSCLNIHVEKAEAKPLSNRLSTKTLLTRLCSIKQELKELEKKTSELKERLVPEFKERKIRQAGNFRWSVFVVDSHEVERLDTKRMVVELGEVMKSFEKATTTADYIGVTFKN